MVNGKLLGFRTPSRRSPSMPCVLIFSTRKPFIPVMTGSLRPAQAPARKKDRAGTKISFTRQSGIMPVKMRDGFNAFVKIKKSEMLVGRVQRIGIETKAHEDAVESKLFLKQSHNGNAPAPESRNGLFAKGI